MTVQELSPSVAEVAAQQPAEYRRAPLWRRPFAWLIVLVGLAFALLPAATDVKLARALAIASKTRSQLAPELPTMGEQGLPDFEFNSWYGVWAPKGTPREISEKVNALIRETMRDPAVVSKLNTTLLEPVAESIDDSRKFIASEIARARELLKLVNFQPA